MLAVSIWGLSVLVIITLSLWLSAGLPAVPSQDRWPPISEDEFIRRCPPGVDRERALKVRRIISQQLGIEYDRIHPEQSFSEDLGCD